MNEGSGRPEPFCWVPQGACSGGRLAAGSLTYGRGTEMTCYKELMRRLNIDIWFADPPAHWQRGSNENTNGLLREFMRKGADLFKASEEYLNNVAHLRNAHPRQTPGWKTLNKASEEDFVKFNSIIVLAS